MKINFLAGLYTAWQLSSKTETGPSSSIRRTRFLRGSSAEKSLSMCSICVYVHTSRRSLASAALCFLFSSLSRSGHTLCLLSPFSLPLPLPLLAFFSSSFSSARRRSWRFFSHASRLVSSFRIREKCGTLAEEKEG